MHSNHTWNDEFQAEHYDSEILVLRQFYEKVNLVLSNSQKGKLNEGTLLVPASQKKRTLEWKTFAKTTLMSKCPGTANDCRLGNTSCT